MKNIKLISFMLLATLFNFSSCNKEDDPDPNEVYQAFLNEREPLITGILNDTTINWRFGRNYQMKNYRSDGDHEHSLNFGLINEGTSDNGFFIRTPTFNKNLKILETPILSQGDKKIGVSNDAFVITYNDAMGNNYMTELNRDQTGSSIKILKTEKTNGPFDRDVILVWFVVNCKLYNTNDNSQMTLKDTKILASFMET